MSYSECEASQGSPEPALLSRVALGGGGEPARAARRRGKYNLPEPCCVSGRVSALWLLSDVASHIRSWLARVSVYNIYASGNTKVDMFVQFLTIKLLLVVTKQEIFLV